MSNSFNTTKDPQQYIPYPFPFSHLPHFSQNHQEINQDQTQDLDSPDKK
jgi:hypothetical protein